MTYEEFTKTYRWMLKKYPQTSSMFPSKDKENEIIGTVTRTKFCKDGSRWVRVEESFNIKEEPITRTNYCNGVDAIPFFRGCGGKELVQMGYTKMGYIPVKITSISPWGDTKTVREYHIK